MKLKLIASGKEIFDANVISVKRILPTKITTYQFTSHDVFAS